MLLLPCGIKSPFGAASYLSSPSVPFKLLSKYSSKPSMPLPSGSTWPIICFSESEYIILLEDFSTLMPL